MKIVSDANRPMVCKLLKNKGNGCNGSKAHIGDFGPQGHVCQFEVSGVARVCFPAVPVICPPPFKLECGLIHIAASVLRLLNMGYGQADAALSPIFINVIGLCGKNEGKTVPD
jgi:hypothetical protein